MLSEQPRVSFQVTLHCGSSNRISVLLGNELAIGNPADNRVDALPFIHPDAKAVNYFTTYSLFVRSHDDLYAVLLGHSACTISCMVEFSNCGLYHKLMKPDRRISIKQKLFQFPPDVMKKILLGVTGVWVKMRGGSFGCPNGAESFSPALAEAIGLRWVTRGTEPNSEGVASGW